MLYNVTFEIFSVYIMNQMR